MAEEWQGLTPEEWDGIKGLLPKYKKPFRRSKRKGGRPRASDKAAFEALIWTMRDKDHFLERLPERFGSRRTACRRLDRWTRDRTLENLWAWFVDGLPPAKQDEWRAVLERGRDDRFWQLMLQTSFRIRCPARKSPPQVL